MQTYQKPGLGRAGGKRTFWKCVYRRSFLTPWNFANFMNSSGMWQRWMLMWICINPSGVARECDIGYWYITAWGFCTFARPTNSGNAKASRCGTGDRYDSHALFYLSVQLDIEKGIEQRHFQERWKNFRKHRNHQSRSGCGPEAKTEPSAPGLNYYHETGSKTFQPPSCHTFPHPCLL